MARSRRKRAQTAQDSGADRSRAPSAGRSSARLLAFWSRTATGVYDEPASRNAPGVSIGLRSINIFRNKEALIGELHAPPRAARPRARASREMVAAQPRRRISSRESGSRAAVGRNVQVAFDRSRLAPRAVREKVPRPRAEARSGRRASGDAQGRATVRRDLRGAANGNRRRRSRPCRLSGVQDRRFRRAQRGPDRRADLKSGCWPADG